MRRRHRRIKMSLVSDDTALVKHLNGILAKLVRASGASDDYVYRLHVLDDPQLNAFTPGGGHVFITTGLIRAFGDRGPARRRDSP